VFLRGLVDLASTAVRAETTHAGEVVFRKPGVTTRPEAAVTMAVAEPMLTPPNREPIQLTIRALLGFRMLSGCGRDQ
jgi:hypothetical protein